MLQVSNARATWLAQQVLPHEAALRSWLHGRSSMMMEVDDVVQETYAVLAGMDDVSGIQNPRAYMFTVANNIMLQHLRRSRIVPIESISEIEQYNVPDRDPTPEQRLSLQQDLRRIGRIIAQLPPKCREVFMLRRIEGLSQREIAARVGISENTVEKHVAKGLRLLMGAMAAGAADENPDKGLEQQRGYGWKKRKAVD
ncbi:RNA polymerase sigma factor [Solimonas marina]|uniref:RNA polymerase sigma factor n=1 Tax=Solimonas marina TaxID=2714601 RepID=A0A970B735_9GAMM|nr:RNA polymerase sigma factor [Solimonas marina]NKF20799.1 RNA polymerase sigma factor [Solimonas marina]